MSCARWLAGKFDSLTAGEGLRAIAHENNGRGPASERFGEFGTEQVKRVAFEACLSDVIDLAFSIGMRVMHTQILLAALAVPLGCLLYTSPSPRDRTRSRMPSSA